MNMLPEYQTLREEIGRLQDQVARSLEVGILITSGILTIGFSSAIGSNFQWLALMSPAFLLMPFVYLIVDRVRTTWFIGRYIELFLEPQLDFHWETFNRKMRGSSGIVRSGFTRSSAVPLIGLQLLSPILALMVAVPNFPLWLALTGFVIFMVVVEFRWTSRYAITPVVISAMESEIKDMLKKHVKTRVSRKME